MKEIAKRIAKLGFTVSIFLMATLLCLNALTSNYPITDVVGYITLAVISITLIAGAIWLFMKK